MLLKKITIGFVVQTFDTDKKEFVKQEFVAGDECSYENQDGESVDSDLFVRIDGKEPYLPYDMVQPSPQYSNKERTKRLCYAMLTGKANDANCHEYDLVPNDLDELYSIAEVICDKARNKKEPPPQTMEEKIQEINSWIEYYFPN